MSLLYALQARNSPTAVLFRRGPSKKVLLIKWDTENDTFEEGQWLKGRVYERRCDLSPNGELLVYFAATWKGPYQSWTAISRPPYFTALALWPKGDAWGGGGLFKTDTKVELNHWSNQMEIAEDSVSRSGSACRSIRSPERAKTSRSGSRGWRETAGA